MINFLRILFNTIWNIIGQILNINIIENLKFGETLLIVIILGLSIRFLLGGKGD